MKRVILFTIVMCCASVTMAQDTLSSKHTFRLQISGASPTGEFNKTEFEDDYPDFALDGILVSASYLRQMTTFISVGSSVHYRTHKFDMDQFASDGDKLVLERDSKPWRSWFTMADVYLYSSEGNSGNFYIKGSAGASFNRSAQVNVSTVFGSIELPAGNASAFAWGYGGGVRGVHQAWSIIIELSQISTSPTFSGKNTSGNIIKYKQPVNSLNFELAISYSF